MAGTSGKAAALSRRPLLQPIGPIAAGFIRSDAAFVYL